MQLWRGLTESRAMGELEMDIEAFDKKHAELETHHKDKWVLFREGKFIGVYDTFNHAAEEAVRQFGSGPYLIRQVGAPPVSLPISVLYHPVHGSG